MDQERKLWDFWAGPLDSAKLTPFWGGNRGRIPYF